MRLKEQRKADAAFDFACVVIEKFRELGFGEAANCVKRWFEQYDEAKKERHG